MPLFHNKIKNTLSFHVLIINDLNCKFSPSANKTERVKKKRLEAYLESWTLALHNTNLNKLETIIRHNETPCKYSFINDFLNDIFIIPC
jgi:hypothetical protein